MKTILKSRLFILMALPAQHEAASNGSASYIIGAIIALLLLGYLIYTLLRPEKF